MPLLAAIFNGWSCKLVTASSLVLETASYGEPDSCLRASGTCSLIVGKELGIDLKTGYDETLFNPI
jgi:hypothetical protein